MRLPALQGTFNWAGYYTIYWEGTPIKKNGQVIKIKAKVIDALARQLPLEVQISIDDGPYTSYSNPWFQECAK